MAKHGYFLFRYIPGESAAHRCPALVKLGALLALSVAAFFSPLRVTAGAIPVLFAAALLWGIPARESLADMRPLLYYALFLYATTFISTWLAAPAVPPAGVSSTPPQSRLLRAVLVTVFDPPESMVAVLVRLSAMLQVSSLLFRTTTTVALKRAIAAVCPPLAVPLALFLGFIPALFEQWARLDRACAARGCRGVGKLAVILPALLSLAFYQADLRAKALAARELP
jgi:biotin transport system permease protein/energy-coupling factor transport system permease protein